MRSAAHGPHRPARAALAGHTLVELAVTVSIAGVISIGVVTIGAQLWAEQRMEDLIRRMASLVEEVDQLFINNVDYQKLDLESAVRLGLLRHERVVAAGSLGPGLPATSSVQHIFSQPITLGVLNGPGFNNLAWGLHYSRLPVDACMTLVGYAVHLFEAVAITSDPYTAARPTQFADWGGTSPIQRSGGKVTGFPTGYEVIKNEKSGAPTVQDRVTACLAVSGRGSSFGLALVRTKL